MSDDFRGAGLIPNFRMTENFCGNAERHEKNVGSSTQIMEVGILDKIGKIPSKERRLATWVNIIRHKCKACEISKHCITEEELSSSFTTPFLLAFLISLVLSTSLLAATNVPGYKNNP